MQTRLRQLVTVIGLTALLTVPAVHTFAEEASSALNVQQAQDQHELEGVEHETASIQVSQKQLEQTLAAAKQQQAQVAATVARLKGEANALLPKIDRATAKLKELQEQLAQAVKLDYQSHHGDTLSVLVENSSVSGAMDRAAYAGQIQQHMQELAADTKRGQEDLAKQKSDLDGKRSTQELAERQLTALQASIGQQQQEQQELLAGKQDEASYLRDRVAKAEAAKSELLKGGNAIWGTFTEGAHVKQNDVIGFQGSTGFSTGCHTHFSVIDGGRWANPGAYASVLQMPGGRLTQGYGMTDWAKTGAYGGNIHNGYDYVSGCGTPVRAAADGVVIRDNRTDGSGFGHYLMIRHQNGLITLYGHLI